MCRKYGENVLGAVKGHAKLTLKTLILRECTLVIWVCKVIAVNVEGYVGYILRALLLKKPLKIGVGKIASFMYKTFPAYTKKAALGNWFGPNLKKAVTEFQRRTKLEADGNVGPKTLAKLRQYGFKG